MIGGNHFVFFQPIFNIADASLSVSVIVLILFYARYLATISPKDKDNEADDESVPAQDEDITTGNQ